ncbi:hypothetical protein FB563_4051 [Streptomyces puniciscabiei]|uniref:Uncharacterized protein n=1 Tax=Streptomyces puniciscabiei TaxID=164348 RepID=A0A542UIU8_9ACTN|nr:hypothetical protein [Streptomyces puniciscabiei]TQK98998.1 hypothetical protein FB563_4051 [Streptomyces puniciscabiei]
MQRPPNLTDAEWAEWLQCQEEEDELLAQVADREARLETGVIDSYDEYEFTWEYADGDRRSHEGEPSTAQPDPATAPCHSTPAYGCIPGLPPGPPRTTRALRLPF